MLSCFPWHSAGWHIPPRFSVAAPMSARTKSGWLHHIQPSPGQGRTPSPECGPMPHCESHASGMLSVQGYFEAPSRSLGADSSSACPRCSATEDAHQTRKTSIFRSPLRAHRRISLLGWPSTAASCGSLLNERATDPHAGSPNGEIPHEGLDPMGSLHWERAALGFRARHERSQSGHRTRVATRFRPKNE